MVMHPVDFFARSASLRIAPGSDERPHLTDYVKQELRRRSSEVQGFGSLRDGIAGGLAFAWAGVACDAAGPAASSQVDGGVRFSGAGAGVSTAAGNDSGVRATLRAGAEGARGTKACDQANVPCLSPRAACGTVAREIADAWSSVRPGPGEEPSVDMLRQLDDRCRPAVSSVLGEKGRS